MEKIKYTQRICEDNEKIEKFLMEKRIGNLSMCDKAGTPYAVPVNYIYFKDKIYFHGMGSGKKNDLLKENSSVCFSIFEEYGTVIDPVPSKCDIAYFSVIIFGKAVLVQELNEKTEALMQLLNKFTPGYFKQPLSTQFVEKYRSSLDNKAVAVYCINIDSLTAKENPIDVEHMFRKNAN